MYLYYEVLQLGNPLTTHNTVQNVWESKDELTFSTTTISRKARRVVTPHDKRLLAQVGSTSARARKVSAASIRTCQNKVVHQMALQWICNLKFLKVYYMSLQILTQF